MAGYALLCPGQGGQHPRMLDFALSTGPGREALAAASEATSTDIVERVQRGEDLFEPVFAQVAIVAATVATWQALAAHVAAPALVAGYSVGEVSAWCCAGSWDVPGVMRVVAQRARFMAQASPRDCAMMAVTSIRREALAAILATTGDRPLVPLEGTPVALTCTGGLSPVHVAIEVDDDHWILAGRREDLEASGPSLEAAGASTHALPVGVPSHTPLLDTAAGELRRFLAGVAGRDPMVPVLRGIDAQPIFAYSAAGEALADAVAHPIRWRACVEECLERGIGAALELPPGASLTRMLTRHASLEARAVADFRSVDGVARWLERAA
jgi:[acyl-carrier-protein] S-malonyltransferase